METSDLDVLGALYHLLITKGGSRIVSPPLSRDELNQLSKKYFERSLLENRDDPGNWSATRYAAGWNIVTWSRQIWRDPQSQQRWAGEIKQWLAALYRKGDESLRSCLVTATLEHLFEDDDIARFFSDWRHDDVMRTPYARALDWRARGGSSPLR